MNKLINQTKVAAIDRQRVVMDTISDMIKAGVDISVQSVAIQCKVSRNYIYRHPELMQIINLCRITGMTKAELQQEVIRLRLRVHRLEQLLGIHGE